MKTGDLVSAVDEDFRGKIISVQGKTAVVEDEHGFSHSIEISRLVPQNHSIYDDIKVVRKPENSFKISKKHNHSPQKIDLHFDRLVSNSLEYEPWERLMIQKEKLVEKLDYCRKNNLKKLEIIHGIGDGILQEMVYNVLRGFAGIEFEDHDFFFHSSGKATVTFL